MKNIEKKMIEYGMDSLNNSEIVEYLLNEESAEYGEKEIKEIVGRGLKNILEKDGNIKLKICVEFAKRVYKESAYSTKISKPHDVADWLQLTYGDKKQEYFICIYLNNAGYILTHKELYKGTSTECVLSPREIFAEALNENARSIILVHNHPSGDCIPSSADIHTTEKLIEAGRLMDIKVNDHIVVTHDEYYSMRNKSGLEWL